MISQLTAQSPYLKMSKAFLLRYFTIKNMGKGAAIRTSLKHATGTIIAIQDADLEYDPKNIVKLTEPILKGDSEVVYGSRFLGKKLMLSGKGKTLLPLHWMGNRVLTFITNLLYFSSITDMETGNKIFKKSVQIILLNAQIHAKTSDKN